MEQLIPVSKQMTPEDAAQVTMLTLMDQIAIALEKLAMPKSYRANRIAALRKQIEYVEHTFTGDLPPIFINKAEVFYDTVIAGTSALLKYAEGDDNESNENAGSADNKGTGSTDGCGEVRQGEQGSGDQSQAGDAGTED